MVKPILEGKVKTECDRTEPIMRPGNTNCGGCGMSIAFNMLTHAVGQEHPVQMVIPACCGIVSPGQFPYSAYGAPVVASGKVAIVAPEIVCGVTLVAPAVVVIVGENSVSPLNV